MEQPIRGLMSLVSHKDVEVNIAVNERGIFIIDPIECVSTYMYIFLVLFHYCIGYYYF